jgi:hypothetical protein
MKKAAIWILCAFLVLSSVSCSLRSNSTESDPSSPQEAGETAEGEISAEENGSTEPGEAGSPEGPSGAERPVGEPEGEKIVAPENVEAKEIYTLELSEPPFYKEGKLVMYFTDDTVFYRPDAVCSIGLISSESAESIPAVLDIDSYPDIKNGDLFRGAVLVPAQLITPGSYTFSVMIAEFIVTFDMTIN